MLGRWMLLLFALLRRNCYVSAWYGSMVSVDVSPTPDQIATNAVFLGGYGALGFRDGATLGFARGVHDPIEARVLYLEDDAGEAFATLVLDVVGVGNVIRDEIRSAASLATTLPMERILVASTHTHAGPDLQGMWGGVERSYRDSIVQGAVEAISRAVATKARVSLSVGSIETGELLGRNRRGWDYVLNTTSVLVLRNDETPTAPVGVLVSFPAHTTILGRSNMQASGDFVGYVCRSVAVRLQAQAAMWISGAVGDVSVVGHGGEGFDRLARYGEVAAEQVAAAILLHETPIPSGGRLDFHTVVYSQEITNLAFVAALTLGVLDDYYETVAGTLATIETIAARVRIGDQVEIVTSPGESLTRNAQPVVDAISAKSSSPVAMTWGLVQDSIGYFVPEDEWMTDRNGNYEESVSPGEDAGDRLRDTLLALVDHQRSPSAINRTATLRVKSSLNLTRPAAGRLGRALDPALDPVAEVRASVLTAAHNGDVLEVARLLSIIDDAEEDTV